MKEWRASARVSLLFGCVHQCPWADDTFKWLCWVLNPYFLVPGPDFVKTNIIPSFVEGEKHKPSCCLAL